MKVIIQHKTKTYLADTGKPLDISIPVKSGTENPNAFFIDPPRFEPVKVGTFVGSVAEGSGANCENLFINAHGNGTHTECVGHITRERISINSVLKEFHFIARVISVTPLSQANGDSILENNSVPELNSDEYEALIIRTLPNSNHKKTQIYSGQNPTYFDPQLCKRISSSGIKHLLTDLPSVDREEDEGAMKAHKAFWNYPENPGSTSTITELVFVDSFIEDGLYLLTFQIASLETDASPSKPVLYRIEEQTGTL